MDFFQNKVIWITGASSGIGEHLTYELGKSSAKIVISARRAEVLEKVKNACTFPQNITVLPLDLSKPETFTTAVEKITSDLGRIDILVNNGGISQRSRAEETPVEIDRKVMEVNFFGNIALTKAVLPTMKRQGSGKIVVTSSLMGKFGFFLRSAYAASKHALHGFYDSLRLEMEDDGISVLLLCPGFIRTDISKNALDSSGKKTGEMDDNQDSGMSPDKAAKEIVRAIRKNKKEVLIGKGETFGAYMKRFAPGLFHKILKKKSAK
ncbi:SDR family oxidoreductase [Halocola ammonii]